jgi:hypothetical protein
MVQIAWFSSRFQRRFPARRLRRLGFLPGDPLANVRRAALQSDARGFTAGEEADGLAVDQPYVFEIERDQLVRSVLVDQPLQLGEMFTLHAAAEHDPHGAGPN